MFLGLGRGVCATPQPSDNSAKLPTRREIGIATVITLLERRFKVNNINHVHKLFRILIKR